MMVGDVIGRPGRMAVGATVPRLRQELNLDLVVANGENTAGGFGITPDTAQELLDGGVDVITSGNHVWDRREIVPYLDGSLPIIRPLNYPPGTPGRGHATVGGALVINLVGRLFIGNYDCPFRAMDALLEKLTDRPMVVIVDMHAEATSEKVALGWHLDGRVSAVVGTHTHVATTDTRVLPGGTAYVSDIGMVGPVNSVIGMRTGDVLTRFITQTPRGLTVAKGGPIRFDSVLIDIDESTGQATGIQRLDRESC